MTYTMVNVEAKFEAARERLLDYALANVTRDGDRDNEGYAGALTGATVKVDGKTLTVTLNTHDTYWDYVAVDVLDATVCASHWAGEPVMIETSPVTMRVSVK